MNPITGPRANTRVAHFIIYVSAVLSLLMILFPPFASINGIEHAFLLNGPTWSRDMTGVAEQFGLGARLDWITLVAQLATVWAIGLGAVWFLTRHRDASDPIAPALAATTLLLAILVPTTVGQPAESETRVVGYVPDQTIGMQGGKYGLGFASAWPSYGVSGTLQMSEALTAEAIVGFLGDLRNFGAKAWYRFNRNSNYDLYGYGTLGLLQYRYTTLSSAFPFETERGTENVLGLGGGVGIESGIQALFKDQTLPPIFLNWELGLSFASFDYYNFSSFIFGGGIHYRFGAR